MVFACRSEKRIFQQSQVKRKKSIESRDADNTAGQLPEDQGEPTPKYVVLSVFAAQREERSYYIPANLLIGWGKRSLNDTLAGWRHKRPL